MRVIAYPADKFGCGHHRVIWPAQELKRLGVDINIVQSSERSLELIIKDDVVQDVKMSADDVDVVVMQRVTHAYMVQAIPIIRAKGIAVVVDVDDDLKNIHPSNPAFSMLHPKRAAQRGNMHSWTNLSDACRVATLVTTSTSALLPHYAPHQRGVVIKNYLAEHYYGLSRVDSNDIAWPASLHSHPNDPEVVGNAVARMIMDYGTTFDVLSHPQGIDKAFRLGSSPKGCDPIALFDWPVAVAKIGIGIAPLADTVFNGSKSWLKPLEMAACGVPWVGSPRTAYQQLHDLGCGLMADTPKQWYQQLRRLHGDATLRAEQAERGRYVADGLRLVDNAWRWLEAWNEALKLERS